MRMAQTKVGASEEEDVLMAQVSSHGEHSAGWGGHEAEELRARARARWGEMRGSVASGRRWRYRYTPDRPYEGTTSQRDTGR